MRKYLVRDKGFQDNYQFFFLSHDVNPRSNVSPWNKIDKPLVVQI